MGLGKNWTPEEEAWLREKWGTVSIDGICKRLNRTKAAIMIRVQRLDLPPFLESGEYVSMHQLLKALGYGGCHTYTIKSWVENRGFPMRLKKRSSKAEIKVVYLEEFWTWAEQNRSFVDFSRMQPMALGAEPPWLQEQRRNDYRSFALQKKTPWTKEEDNRLRDLLGQFRYGYAELSSMLCRSEGAILRRARDLGLRERPVKADNHGDTAAWRPEHYRILADGIRGGISYSIIADQLGKSEKAIRGKAYFDYFTENADKIRAMLGAGEWGHGAPTPTVRQALHHSRYRIDTKVQIEAIAGILLYRLKQLKKDDVYFQKESCQHWSLFKGCTMGETDCDACPHFLRIKPQYCCRCGATFLEREEQTFCPACRAARRKQAQKKWARLNAGKRG